MASSSFHATVTEKHALHYSRLLQLLEAESFATYNRIAEVLGVSRMTVCRMTEPLLQKGLLLRTKGRDPISGRISHLLSLTQDCPFMAVYLDQETLFMTAYYFEKKTIRQLTTECKISITDDSNLNDLCNIARHIWQLSPQTPCIEVYHSYPLHGDPSDYFFDTFDAVTYESVMTRALTCLPIFKDSLSFLQLHSGDATIGTLFVREHKHAPWFMPMGARFVNPLLITYHHSNAAALASLLSDYCKFFQPDTVLLELFTEETDYHIQNYPMSFQPTHIGEAHSWSPETVLLETSLASAVPSGTSVWYTKNAVPLWAWGMLSLYRESLWRRSSLL